MRTLTISRTKTSVASLYKLHVYIEDENGDMSAGGKKYRFLGDLKNGESRIFEIDEQEREVFVYFTDSSKGFCNDTHLIEAGAEDVVLTGKCHYNPANGNAFRFDGHATEEVVKNRKKANKAGIIVLVVAFVVGIVVGLWRNGLFDKVEPKEFTYGNMSITLTDDFTEDDNVVNYTSSYESVDVLVITLQEKTAGIPEFTNLTLDGYADLVIKATDLPATTEIVHKDGLTYFEYNADSSGKEYNYFTVVYQSGTDFWTVQFITVAKYADDHRAEIIDWAKTVKFN